MVATFFHFSLSQLGCFPIEQIISICWAKRIRKCRYNVVRTCLMLKQRCSNFILANYSKQIVTFLLSFFVDFNRLVLSEIILVKGLDYSILLSVIGFVEYLGGDIIYNNILQCYVKYIQLKNSFLKHITKNSPNQLVNKNVYVLGCSTFYKKVRHVKNWKHLEKMNARKARKKSERT